MWPCLLQVVLIKKGYGTIHITQYRLGEQIENKTGGACSTYGGEKGCVQGFGGETRGRETTWETQA